ncbi:MAG: hypothetical protein GOMPHAMPRED_003779 [Gomphillus americanus]|uniref:Uncharacterized protein n=1 Tax=Gomphillus americanus TaxID=1940652 RepID=A0A8H3IMY3_9LECA|nr:MAG: hypothetical protein GOMPHAMPRED_003779 [Gomphillus americanus]
MSPIPLVVTVPDALLTSMSSAAPVSDTQSYLEKRWQFSGSSAEQAEASWEPGWNWARTKGWAGTWEVGKLVMATGVVFGGMFGGFLLIVLIFWSCGMLDDRRLKRRARKFAKGRPPMKEPEPMRLAVKKATPFGVIKKQQDDGVIEKNQGHVSGVEDSPLSVSKHDANSVRKSGDLEKPISSSCQKDEKKALALESILKGRSTRIPSGWSWDWSERDSYGSSYQGILELISSARGSKTPEDLTIGRQWAVADRAVTM